MHRLFIALPLFFVDAIALAQAELDAKSNAAANWSGVLESILIIVLLCVVFGALGGLVAHYINNEKIGSSKDSKSSDLYSFPSWCQSCVIGIAGALGFLFFIAAVGGISTSFDSLQEYMRTISSSVIAGFGARNLLPKMAGHLEQQVAEAASKADEAIDDAKSNEVKIRRLDAHMKLVQASHPHATLVSREKALRLGQDLINSGDANSATWMNMARAHRWAGNLESAIEKLDAVILSMESGVLDQINFGAALYNRACYNALLFKKSNEIIYLQNCLDDLKTFLGQANNRSEEIKYLTDDDDLKHLADQAEFKAIIS